MAKQKTKPKLSNSALYFKEKCPCGTEIEFESSTGMVFDKMMARWDKQHQVHVEDAAHPPVAVFLKDVVAKQMGQAATKLEKEILADPMTNLPNVGHGSEIRPATTQAAKKTKKPSVVEMEKISNARWADKSEYEQQRAPFFKPCQQVISANTKPKND